MRRVLPAFTLFLVAPLVAEFLLGNLPITWLFTLVLLAPMYGGGALLIREVVRRSGRGLGAMLVLGVAYGLVEEGLVTQSLFNPGYVGAHLLDQGFVPALGIAVPWTLFVVTLHAVWSTTVPIVLVEACVPDKRTTPWLRTPGIVVTVVLFVIGLVGDTATTLGMDPFVAPLPQLVGVVVVAAGLMIAAFRLPAGRSGPMAADRPVPPAVVLGVVALVAGATFELASSALPTWPGVAVLVAVEAAVMILVAHWSRSNRWTPRHAVALAGGALLTYAWHAFPEHPVVPVSPTTDLVGNAVFAAAALALLATALRRSTTLRAQETTSVPVRT
ncbi:hypothetical protein [Pseudonocardia sp.]|jgi:hypothetical protein|uniref:hypothetical protein n=1 Tax=Pseudonocardia sp. TaxID=60912 RepID=UPI0031FC97FF